MNDTAYVIELDCRKRHAELMAAINAIDRRLFRDNGSLSIQTRIDRHEQTLRSVCKIVYGAVSLILLSVAGALLAMVIRGGL